MWIRSRHVSGRMSGLKSEKSSVNGRWGALDSRKSQHDACIRVRRRYIYIYTHTIDLWVCCCGQATWCSLLLCQLMFGSCEPHARPCWCGVCGCHCCSFAGFCARFHASLDIRSVPRLNHDMVSSCFVVLCVVGAAVDRKGLTWRSTSTRCRSSRTGRSTDPERKRWRPRRCLN